MRTSPAGAINRNRRESGVTLVELLIVATLIALVVGLSFPSMASGISSLRLRSASDSMIAFLNTALDRADRRQQTIEIAILPKENALTARAMDASFTRRLDVPDPIRILSISPAVDGEPGDARHFLVYPGGAIPAITVEIGDGAGRRRKVSVDPVTGVPRSELQAK